MSKTSVKFRVIALAVLITLALASLPTAGVVAKETNEGLEQKWDQLITNFDTQSSNHNSAHRWVEHWLKTDKNASVSDKNEVGKHLAICNSAILAAGTIVSKHAGFDAKGQVVNRAAATKSIKDLSYFLRQHAGSIKNLSEHINT